MCLAPQSVAFTHAGTMPQVVSKRTRRVSLTPFAPGLHPKPAYGRLHPKPATRGRCAHGNFQKIAPQHPSSELRCNCADARLEAHAHAACTCACACACVCASACVRVRTRPCPRSCSIVMDRRENDPLAFMLPLPDQDLPDTSPQTNDVAFRKMHGTISYRRKCTKRLGTQKRQVRRFEESALLRSHMHPHSVRTHTRIQPTHLHIHTQTLCYGARAHSL